LTSSFSRLMANMDEQLRDLFYSDTLLGLATPKQLALAARESGLALTQAEARDFIRKQAVTQRFRPIARKAVCARDG